MRSHNNEYPYQFFKWNEDSHVKGENYNVDLNRKKSFICHRIIWLTKILDYQCAGKVLCNHVTISRYINLPKNYSKMALSL